MKLLCISLGCDKNLVDSEKMLGLLYEDGFTFTDDEREADVILVNTCCFIGDVISRDALHHDVDATIFGYNPGEVSSAGMP